MINVYEVMQIGALTQEGKKAARAVRRLLKPGRRVSEARVAYVVSKATSLDFAPKDPKRRFVAGVAMDALIFRVVRGARTIWSDTHPHITYTVPLQKR